MINGIKPTLTKTTELKLKPTSFAEAMVKFLIKLELLLILLGIR